MTGEGHYFRTSRSRRALSRAVIFLAAAACPPADAASSTYGRNDVPRADLVPRFGRSSKNLRCCFAPFRSSPSTNAPLRKMDRRQRRCPLGGATIPRRGGASSNGPTLGTTSVFPNDKGTDAPVGNVGETDRRRALRRLFLSAAATLASGPSATDGEAGAACLPGDLDISCIGVYKVPIDDNIRPYTSTPEQLKKFAPDLRWVPHVELPKKYDEAYSELSMSLRERCMSLKEKVLRGKLEEAGVELLGITPRVTACGRAIVIELNRAAEKQKSKSMSSTSSNKSTPVDYSMKSYRISEALSELEASLGSCDVLIGQGLRGELGVSAPAQILILAEINEMNENFATLMEIVPSKIQ